jgi:hypothetical protein
MDDRYLIHAARLEMDDLKRKGQPAPAIEEVLARIDRMEVNYSLTPHYLESVVHREPYLNSIKNGMAHKIGKGFLAVNPIKETKGPSGEPVLRFVGYALKAKA